MAQLRKTGRGHVWGSQDLLRAVAADNLRLASSRNFSMPAHRVAPQRAAFVAINLNLGVIRGDYSMTTLEAFVLGIMVAWTPSLLLLVWCLLRDLPEVSD